MEHRTIEGKYVALKPGMFYKTCFWRVLRCLSDTRYVIELVTPEGSPIIESEGSNSITTLRRSFFSVIDDEDHLRNANGALDLNLYFQEQQNESMSTNNNSNVSNNNISIIKNSNNPSVPATLIAHNRIFVAITGGEYAGCMGYVKGNNAENSLSQQSLLEVFRVDIKGNKLSFGVLSNTHKPQWSIRIPSHDLLFLDFDRSKIKRIVLESKGNSVVTLIDIIVIFNPLN